MKVSKKWIVPVCAMLSGGQLCAQTPSDAENALTKSIELMDKLEWKSALDTLEPIKKKYADNGVKTFGAKFGIVYYYSGLSSLKLAEQMRDSELPDKDKKHAALLQKAITDFTKCHSINPENDPANIYHAKALLFLAKAQQGLEQYEKALKSYDAFLLERHSIRDSYNIGLFNLNRAICLWKQKDPQLEKGTKLFLESIEYTGRNELTPKLETAGIKAFMLVHLEANETAKLNQAFQLIAMRNLLEKIAKNSPDDLENLLLFSAQQDMPRVMSAIIRAIPDKGALIAEKEQYTQLRKALLNAPDQQIQLSGETFTLKKVDEKIAALTRQLNASHKLDQARSIASAVLYENSEYYRGSYAGYQQLTQQFPKHPLHANHLYALTRNAALAGEIDKVKSTSATFLATFPEHELADAVRLLLVTTLYYSERYEEALLEAKAIVPSSKPDTELDELCTFVIGASSYYISEFKDAAFLLEGFLAAYPENEQADTASYLRASAISRLQKWEQAAELLENYIAKHKNNKDSIYTPFAIYDLAYMQYVQDDYKSALKTLDKFSKRYPHSNILPQALILTGNNYLQQKVRMLAISKYMQALEAGKRLHHKRAIDEAYYLLIDLVGKHTWDGLTNEHVLEAIPYYDAFMARQPKDSPFYLQTITSAQYALKRAKREDEGLKTLVNAIFDKTSKRNTPGTEGALDTYIFTRLYNETSVQDLMLEFQNKSTEANTRQNSLAIYAQINLLERRQRAKPSDENMAKINALYLDLLGDISPEIMDNFILLKLANHLEAGSNIKDAKIYYSAILNSGSDIKKKEAQLELAKLDQGAGDAADLAKRAEKYRSFIEDPTTSGKAKAEAQYQLLEVLYLQEKWQDLSDGCVTYLKYRSSYKEHSRRVELLYAIAYDKMHFIDLAVSSYRIVLAQAMTQLEYSAVAMDRITTIFWQRNRPADTAEGRQKSDRQLAYENLYKYIKRTQKAFDANKDDLPKEATDLWEELKGKVDKLADTKYVTPFK